MGKIQMITLDYDMTLRREAVTKRDGYVLNGEEAVSLSPLNVFPWGRAIPYSMEDIYKAPTPPTDVMGDWDMAVVHYSNDWGPLGDFSEDYMVRSERERRDGLAHTRIGRSNKQKDALSRVDEARSQGFTLLTYCMTFMGAVAAILVALLAVFGGTE